MSKAKRPSGGSELVINVATCLHCGTPVGRGCACPGADQFRGAPDLLFLPGESGPGVPTANRGYEDAEGDLLPLPGDDAHAADAPFAVNDRVTWVTNRGRRRAGTITSIRRSDRTAEVEVPGRVLPVRVNLEELASAADKDRPVGNVYRGDDPMPY